jgi:transposase-like protein
VKPTDHIKLQLGKLDAPEIIDLQAFIAELTQRQAVEIALVKRSDAIVAASSCVHCGLSGIVRWGKSKTGTQRFKCMNCKATFSTTNGTPVYRLRNRHLWSKYLGLMRRHIPLRELKDHHGLDLNMETLHRWRHRFLTVMVANPSKKLAGMIEADEKFFATSFKGSRGWKHKDRPQDRAARKRGGANQRGTGDQQVPVVTASDRSGAIYQRRVPNLKKITMVAVMKPWIEGDSVLCTDGHAAYPGVAAATGCEHIVVKNKAKGIHGANHRHLSIGRIDAYHRDVENLINRRCMGVGTRYLMNYFGWARRITQHKPFGNDLLSEMLGV